MLITTNLFKNKAFQSELKKLKFEKTEDDVFERKWESGAGAERMLGSITIKLTEFNRVDVCVFTPMVEEWQANDKNPDALLDAIRACANVASEIRAVFEALSNVVSRLKACDEKLGNDFVSYTYKLSDYNSDGTYDVYGVNAGGDWTKIGQVKLNDFMNGSQINAAIRECIDEYEKRLWNKAA